MVADTEEDMVANMEVDMVTSFCEPKTFSRQTSYRLAHLLTFAILFNLKKCTETENSFMYH